MRIHTAKSVQNIDFVDEAIHMRCNNFFNFVVSETGLFCDACNHVNFACVACMYVQSMILN